jgi:comEA protein
VVVLLLCCCALGSSKPLEIRQRIVSVRASDGASVSDSVRASDSVSDSDSATALVDLNRASVGELRALPGIGPVIAGRIVEHREEVGRFRRVTDLVRVRGIGTAKLEQLRGRVSVDVESHPNAGRDGHEEGVEEALRVGGHPIAARVRAHEPASADQVVNPQ